MIGTDDDIIINKLLKQEKCNFYIRDLIHYKIVLVGLGNQILKRKKGVRWKCRCFVPKTERNHATEKRSSMLSCF